MLRSLQSSLTTQLCFMLQSVGRVDMVERALACLPPTPEKEAALERFGSALRRSGMFSVFCPRTSAPLGRAPFF